MEKLIATKPIYYKGKNYVPGEEILAKDAELVEAWKRAGSVKELPGQENVSMEADSEETTEKQTEEEAAESAKDVEEPVRKGKRGK